MSAIRKVVIVPAWGQVAESNYYPWLKGALSAKGLEVSVLPSSPTDIPTHVRALADLCPNGPGPDTIYIGHSVGCQGLLRWFNSAKEGTKVGGLLCVAGWMFIENATSSPHRSAGLQGFITNSWDKLSPWVNVDYDPAKLRNMFAKKPLVILSRDDPFTIDQDENAKIWNERLGAEAIFFDQGKKHFNDKEYPEFLPLIDKLL